MRKAAKDGRRRKVENGGNNKKMLWRIKLKDINGRHKNIILLQRIKRLLPEIMDYGSNIECINGIRPLLICNIVLWQMNTTNRFSESNIIFVGEDQTGLK